jgi:hypothetical protein
MTPDRLSGVVIAARPLWDAQLINAAASACRHYTILGFTRGCILSGMSEPEFYRAVTTSPYPKEFGERQSARRRGLKFEQNLFANNAAKLCKATAKIAGADPDRMYVRNLDDEVPGNPTTTYVRRWQRTRKILETSVQGQIAHIVIHPVLRLTAPASRNGQFWIVPDFLVWDAERKFRIKARDKRRSGASPPTHICLDPGGTRRVELAA